MSAIQITDEKPLNIYRTEIPNIVFDIGLSCYELTLYAHLRRTAGPGGICTKGVRRLAEESGMSFSQVASIRRKLCEPREELNGKPLIRVEEIEQENCKVRHHVTIVDIWRENFDRFDRSHPSTPRVHTVNTPVQGAHTPCAPDAHKKELSSKGSNVAPAPVDESSIKSKESEPSEISLPKALDTDDFVEAWGDWVSFRAERRIRPYQIRGANAQLLILAEMGEQRAIAAIKWSIAQQYQGIYEQKKDNNGSSHGQNRNAGTFNAGRSGKFAGVERLA